LENPSALHSDERNKYILRWLADSSEEGGRAVVQLDTETRLKMLMDVLNSGNGKNAAVLKYPFKP
jgi:hypothetical protein